MTVIMDVPLVECMYLLFTHLACCVNTRYMNSTRGATSLEGRTAHEDNKRPESPTLTLTWHACKHKVQKLHLRYILLDLSLIHI